MEKRKVLIFGAEGMLGTDLCAAFRARPEWVVAPSAQADCDVTEAAAVQRVVEAERPAAVINCAAYTRVDEAETNEALVMAVNAEAAGHIARTARAAGSKVVQISTEYIFDGTKRTPYVEEDPPSPISVYGKSKWGGEEAVRQSGADFLILRTSWLYGSHGHNFVRTLLRLAQEREEIDMVNDQVGAPTWTEDLAAVVPALLEQNVDGVLHVVNSGYTSWYDFARKIVATAGVRLGLRPITSEQLGRAAKRPKNSRLSAARFERRNGSALRSWESAVEEYLNRGQSQPVGGGNLPGRQAAS